MQLPSLHCLVMHIKEAWSECGFKLTMKVVASMKKNGSPVLLIQDALNHMIQKGDHEVYQCAVDSDLNQE